MDKIKAVILHPKINAAMSYKIQYRTPEAYVSDVEAMLNVSYMTARRIYSKIRQHYGIAVRHRPTMEQVKQYLISQ